MAKKGKLELTWAGKDERPRLEPRVLVEDRSKSYGDPTSENRLIFGDNLLALKALEQEFAGKIKCIFIDPPYNTGSAFKHYDDGLEHSIWLTMMRDRLEVLRNLLANEGSIWISIDDNECHYLKVVLDEVFGRTNFIANVIWQKKFSPQNDAKWLSDMHDHILVFAKQKMAWKPNLLPRSLKQEKNFKNPDNDPRGPWASADYTCAKSMEERPNLYYPITNPNTSKKILPKSTRVWAFDQAHHLDNARNNLVWWGKNGDNPVPRFKKFPQDVRQGTVPVTVWPHSEVGNNQEGRRETLAFNENEPFSTPKPERLIERVLTIATGPSDWVLDSFSGSGTTGAVAQKMGRRWIMCELGDHCHTHIIPRMKQVVDGSDQGGITKAMDWKGGGGFKYYRLAESLLVQDKELSTNGCPVYVINPRYDEKMLIRAICKIENFRYRHKGRLHGVSSERRFLHVTTRLLTQAYLESLAEDLGPDQSMLIYCTRRSRRLQLPDMIEIKKIPRDLLAKCDFEEEK